MIHDHLTISFSTMNDGSMSKAVSETERDENRRHYLDKQGISPKQAILVHLEYKGDDYRRYVTVGRGDAGDGIVREPTIVADALFTRDKNIALLLPVADCIGAVLYDPTNEVLGLAHLGRHNLLQRGGTETIRYMQDRFATDPKDIHVWLSPAAGKTNYPLHDFGNKSMHEVATMQLLDAGVLPENVIRDERDTTTDPAHFSHSEFLKGNRLTDGRQAVVVTME